MKNKKKPRKKPWQEIAHGEYFKKVCDAWVELTKDYKAYLIWKENQEQKWNMIKVSVPNTP